MTGVCDNDVDRICQRKDVVKKAVFNIGLIGRCLSRQLASNKPMQPPCRALVIVAAPRVSPCPFFSCMTCYAIDVAN
jgi:hypothetical protein